MIDLFSRYVVGWMLAEKENADMVAHFLRESVRHAQQEHDLVYLTNHSDRGAAMMALKTQEFLDEAGIKRSYSRPRVSDDNAFIEAFFKTLKYTSTYEGFFQSKAHAAYFALKGKALRLSRPSSMEKLGGGEISHLLFWRKHLYTSSNKKQCPIMNELNLQEAAQNLRMDTATLHPLSGQRNTNQPAEIGCLLSKKMRYYP